MNNETPVLVEYDAAITFTIAKMVGNDYTVFRLNCASSIRGILHLAHETGAISDRFIHYLDWYSDVSDERPRWNGGYVGLDCLMRW